MDKILLDHQKGILDKDEAISELRNIMNRKDAKEILVNTLAFALKSFSLREENVHSSFNLMFEFGFKMEKERVDPFTGFSKLVVGGLLLEGVTAKDLVIRANALVGLNIALRVMEGEDLNKFDLCGKEISQILFRIVLNDKSLLARGVSISILGLIPDGKDHLIKVIMTYPGYVERFNSLSVIQLRFLDEADINSLMSRMLDENFKVRKSFYKSLLKNLDDFAKLMPKVISWSHLVIICQFGLNDMDESVRKSCLNFVVEFIGRTFGGGTFSSNAFVSFLDKMVESISAEDSFDITAANLEVVAELLLPNIFDKNRQNANSFFQSLFEGESSDLSDTEKRPMVISELKPSRVLSIRIMVENFSRELNIDSDDRFTIEYLILSISKCSNNSFLIRQILLIIASIDLGDPDVRKTVKSLAMNCLKYTPFDDSSELLESELIPLESMIRSSEGGEWVAYFLHRSAIWASIRLLETCLDNLEFLDIIRSTIEQILNPSEENSQGSKTELSMYSIEELVRFLDDHADIDESDESFTAYQNHKDMAENRWMRVLFILESAMSVLTYIEMYDFDYWTDYVLKESTRFFVKYSQDQGIPQILLARCTALITVVHERSLPSTSITEYEDDNLLFFIHGLHNAMKELSKNVSSSPDASNQSVSLYTSVQCEVYVSSIVDILIIRQIKKKGALELTPEVLKGLSMIWKLACGTILCTHRLSSISLRGISRILLCLKENTENNKISAEILSSFLYLTYMTDTLDEFNVLVEPQGFTSLRLEEAPSEPPSSTLDVFLVDKLIGFKDLVKSSGDKQMLIYLFSTYLTISPQHCRNFTVSVFKLLEKICESVGVTTWSSNHSKDASKFLVFGMILLRQANEHFGGGFDSEIASYSSLYGLLSLFLMSIRFPKHIRKMDLRRAFSYIYSYFAIGIKDKDTNCLEWIVLKNILKTPEFSDMASYYPSYPLSFLDEEVPELDMEPVGTSEGSGEARTSSHTLTWQDTGAGEDAI
ncbi:hypothetical protein OIY81_1876 [Cryptosporidium canis]|uniref:Uncharacterized protein n=1 Tax=Cryptosporidium canis TaxID=195482 RepID=A0ABQ8P2P8_9CRYT|nr:hypothetical protein OJ252_3446 [Cryptosporidium canis]KAJ1610994.1 hypothetical protein OIY81_1876 [Cryptosporidium canis]